jgi:hypothetical protein
MRSPQRREATSYERFPRLPTAPSRGDLLCCWAFRGSFNALPNAYPNAAMNFGLASTILRQTASRGVGWVKVGRKAGARNLSRDL